MTLNNVRDEGYICEWRIHEDYNAMCAKEAIWQIKGENPLPVGRNGRQAWYLCEAHAEAVVDKDYDPFWATS